MAESPVPVRKSEHFHGMQVLRGIAALIVMIDHAGQVARSEAPVVNGLLTPLDYCHVDTNFLTQLKFLGAYMIPRIEIQVSGQHNGVWYNCTFTKSPQNSYDWDPSNWTFASAHAQTSGGGSGTMHRAHPGGGLTTLQPGYLGYQPTRMRIRSRS